VRQARDSFNQAKSSALDSLATRRQHLRWFVAGFILPLFGGVLASVLTQSSTSTANTAAITTPPNEPFDPSTLTLAAPISEPIGTIVEFVVGRNDTLERIFRRANFSLEDLATIRGLPGMREALDMLRPGELISLTHIDGVLQKLTRRLSETELLSVNREPEGFAARVVATPVETRTTTAQGTIETSLFNAARTAGMSPELIMRAANDIFGWDIDFALDIQNGDKFAVIYERKFRDGEYLGDGQILAAEFINDGRLFRAVRFQSADGMISDYFTPDGKSMRKQFLRAPVDFKYISSNFSFRRMHPILNIARAHQGVDYSAPTGTPVKASGDGRVTLAGAKGGYGNAIILEHGGGISSLYGHLSRFAGTTRVGARVKQGDIIGFVGTTGTSTAPHLHYEYRINGIHKNPRTVSLPDALPIPAGYLEEFRVHSDIALAQLDRSKTAQVVAAPTR
jgi:murein DD-endopeptidase MepM/ murein hydrolase activator NlpD